MAAWLTGTYHDDRLLVEAGFAVSAVTPSARTLEDVYRDAMAGSLAA